ncbi:MAG: sugar transferase, partial [Calditrichaeota bacterium]|nr:sugar transferase [Calditrichota bacterium]
MSGHPSSRIWLVLGAVLSDFLAILGSMGVAYSIRFGSAFLELIPAVNGVPPYVWYGRLAVLWAVMTTGLLIGGNYYRVPNSVGLAGDLVGAAVRFVVAATILLAGLFFYRELTFSRLTLGLAMITGLILLGLSRGLWQAIRRVLYRRGIGLKRAAIVGSGDDANLLLRHIQNHPRFGYSAVGLLGTAIAPNHVLPVLGNIADAGNIVPRYQIDTIIVSGQEGKSLVADLVRACYGINVEFLYVPDINLPAGSSGTLSHPTGPRRIVEVGGVPLWALKETPFTGWPGLTKRLFDFIAASSILLTISPLLIIVVLAVKLTSRGPVFYSQRRVGLDGRVFNCLKFRSMRPDAEVSTGAVWAQPGDPRVTTVGRFLRRFSLDELPQLLNVVKGDM